MRVLYFGTYDRAHPRNSNAIAAMETAGIEVVERGARVRGGRGPRSLLSVLRAETRLSLPQRAEADVVIVGYPGHFDVPRARRVARGRPLVFDAVLSLEHELVDVRRRFGAGSTAATVLRAVDARALRLPDLVVCGTAAEARHLESLGAERTAVVFLGADEEVFSEGWAPTYPFSATHVADGFGTLEVARAAEDALEVPLRVVEPDAENLGLAVAHTGVLIAALRPSRAIPAVVFGALRTGTPVVAGDTDAMRELLADRESALLVPPDDPDALAHAVNELAADEELRKHIGANGSRVFEERASRRVLGARWREVLSALR